MEIDHEDDPSVARAMITFLLSSISPIFQMNGRKSFVVLQGFSNVLGALTRKVIMVSILLVLISLIPFLAYATQPEDSLPYGEKIQVTTVAGATKVTEHFDTIVIKNNSNSTVESLRIMLSPELSNSFYLDKYSIQSIEPNSNATINIRLIGKPNTDTYGKVDAYHGKIIVMAPNHSPVTLTVEIASTSSYHYSRYMSQVFYTSQQRYTRTAQLSNVVDNILSVLEDKRSYNYRVTTSSGDLIITSASDDLLIKNLSNQPLKNIRIFASKPSNLFILGNHTIDFIGPYSEVSVKLKSRIDGPNPHGNFSGEIIVAPVNGGPIVMPIRIQGESYKKEVLDVKLLSGSDRITDMFEKIIIRNNTSKPIDNVRLILPMNIAKVFDLSLDSFQVIPASEEISVDFRLRKGNSLMSFTNDYTGELIIASANGGQQAVIPISIAWEKISSDHFIVYVRGDPMDMSKAKELVDFLESKYELVVQKLGNVGTKTVIYILNSPDELNLITDSAVPYYYSYKYDIGFISANSYDANEAALHLFIYRSIISNNPSYWNREKILFDKGNWLIDGITNYIVANITGKQADSKLALLAPDADPVWYNTARVEDYAATYSFLEFIEHKYGSRTIESIIEYMASGMISNHRCDTLESCAVLRAVYDSVGWDLDNKRYSLNFSKIVEDWKSTVTITLINNEISRSLEYDYYK